MASPALAASSPAEEPGNTDRADAARRTHRFVSPATRMLLAADGLTTALLEAWAAGPVRVAARRLTVADAVRFRQEAHLLATTRQLLVHETQLAGEDTRVWAVSTVIARGDVQGRVGVSLRGELPLGPALRSLGDRFSSTLVEVGHSAWPLDEGTPAASRTYTLRHGNVPLAVVREMFNPALVDAGVRAEPSRVPRRGR